MELIKAIVLGVVQGATEFLPVSSSGHLVLGSHLLGFKGQGLVFDVMVHLGTLLSVVLVFRKEIARMVLAPLRRLAGRGGETEDHYLLWDLYLIVATLPAVAVGLSFREQIAALFTSVTIVCLMLIVTGLMMIASRFVADGNRPVTGGRALLMGCGQALAIVPGVSRSGTTIFVGMLTGINRETAARFSFIMSIPAILGAAVLNLGEVVNQPPGPGDMFELAAGTVAAAATGYLAINLLLDVIRKNRLPWFGYYCLAVAAVGLLLTRAG